MIFAKIQLSTTFNFFLSIYYNIGIIGIITYYGCEYLKNSYKYKCIQLYVCIAYAFKLKKLFLTNKPKRFFFPFLFGDNRYWCTYFTTIFPKNISTKLTTYPYNIMILLNNYWYNFKALTNPMKYNVIREG